MYTPCTSYYHIIIILVINEKDQNKKKMNLVPFLGDNYTLRNGTEQHFLKVYWPSSWNLKTYIMSILTTGLNYHTIKMKRSLCKRPYKRKKMLFKLNEFVAHLLLAKALQRIIDLSFNILKATHRLFPVVFCRALWHIVYDK